MLNDSYPIKQQTELEAPIKIKLSSSTDARNLLVRQAEIASGDSEDPLKWAAVRVVTNRRQKTQMVVKTREEACSLSRFLKFASIPSKQTKSAFERVRKELKSGLKRQGLELDTSDRYKPEILEIDGCEGKKPSDIEVTPGDIIQVEGGALGYHTTKDGERIPSKDYRDVEVDTLFSEKLLVRDRTRLVFIKYDKVEAVNLDRMEQRRIRYSVREKRKQADWDALADLVKNHLKKVAHDVWSGETVPVDQIAVDFNPLFSWLGGRYHPRSLIDGPKIELSKKMYVSKGLAYLYSVARHELIHAWQDYHPDGHPPDTHKHHGRDFWQWVDTLDTHRYCNY